MAPVPTLEVKLSAAYSIEQIDRLLRDLSPILTLDRPARLRMDLSGLVHMCPAALSLLTAAMNAGYQRGLQGGQVLPPKSKPVDNYLLRMNVYRLLGVDDYSEDFTRRDPDGFRPCQNFTDEAYHVVASEMTKALTEACETDDVARASVRICLDELAENVLHHADAPGGGYAAAQVYRKSGKFEVGIVDLGIGVPASLRKNPAYADISGDVAAVQTALELGVTSTPERNAGIGLFVTKLLLKGNGGILMVRSGTATVVAGASERTATTDVALPGTLVTIRVMTDHPLDINEVYKAIDADGSDFDD